MTVFNVISDFQVFILNFLYILYVATMFLCMRGFDISDNILNSANEIFINHSRSFCSICGDSNTYIQINFVLLYRFIHNIKDIFFCFHRLVVQNNEFEKYLIITCTLGISNDSSTNSII